MIGILAIQGGYEAHLKMFQRLNVQCCYVRTAVALQKYSALIIPGGESTTLLWFIEKNGLFEAILTFAKQNKPIFGTCAGAILLAKKVTHPAQKSFDLIDIQIERNGYGRQLASHIAEGIFLPDNKKTEMVFIRAPKISSYGKQVEIIGQCTKTGEDKIVCVRQKNILAATFHPELSDDLCWHRYFLEMI